MRTLVPNSPIPLHIQLEEILRDNIANNVWTENSLIPSENELSRQYGLSRMTVRSVILRLAQEGLVYRVPGKGTFVSAKKIVGQPLSQMGIREQLDKMGYQSVTKLIRAEEIPARVSIAKKLQIAAGTPVYEIRRLRSVEGVPFSIHTSYIPKAICPEILKAGHDFETDQLCDILINEYGIDQSKMVETLEAVQANNEEATLLGFKKNHPLIHLENIIFNDHDIPVEYSSVLIRGDKMKIEIKNTYKKVNAACVIL